MTFVISKTIEYRASRESDLDRISDLFEQYAQGYVPVFDQPARIEELHNIRDEKAHCLLAVDNGTIAGLLVWQPYKKQGYAYVANVLVVTEYRRKGISIELRRRAFCEMKEHGFCGVYYTTWDRNSSMIESSRNLGMELEDVYLDEGFRGKGGQTYLFRLDFEP